MEENAKYTIGKTNARGNEIVEYPIDRYSLPFSIPKDLSLAALPKPYVVIVDNEKGDVNRFEVIKYTGFTKMDGVWHREWEIIDRPITYIANTLKEEVTTKRWEFETGGIMLPNGIAVKTDVSDQNRITSVIANMELARIARVDFKAVTGWVELTVDELKQVATFIARHVQSSFSKEKAHHQAIDALVAAGDIEGLKNYNIDSGWE